MAKKPVLQKRVKKTVRKTHNEVYLVNRKYLGDEPSFDGPVLRTELSRALTWYTYMSDHDEAREYIIDYLKANKKDQLIKKVKRVPNNRLPLTAAWVFRLSMRGAQLEGDSVERAFALLQASFNYMEEEKKEEETVVIEKPTIQDRIADKMSEYIGDIEAIIDNPPADFSMYKHLTATQFPAKLTTKVAEYYKPMLVEMAEALLAKDEQVKEGYKSYTKAQIKERLALYTMIVEDCERYAGNIKKARAPRKSKPITAEKKLKHIKYLKEDNSLKLKSVNPETILGAQELWTYNTKNKLLTVYRARGPAGLDVNRMSITGFDQEASTSKRIGRKTEDVLNRVLNGGKIVLRKIFDEISSDKTEVNERLNNNIILLKTVR
jgi:hypothetical protein